MAQLRLFTLFSLVAALQAALTTNSTENVSTCRAEGKIYHNSEVFKSGVDECASCICIDSKIKCDVLKCQAFALNQPTDNSFDDYANIKDQLMEPYFSQYDYDKLRRIKRALHCATSYCPQLIARSEINYTVESLDRQKFTGRTSNQNRVVFHTANSEAVNNSPVRQVIKTVGYSLKVTQSSEVTITKTRGISAGVSIRISFFGFGFSFTFGSSSSETRRLSEETTFYVPSQSILMDPYTKFNVTSNFYQYENIDNCFLDFVIGKDSIIRHPESDGFGNLHFVKRPLHRFLMQNPHILLKMKYNNDTNLKIIEKNGQFVLKNLPATVKIVNFGVDVSFGKAESIP